MSKVEFSLVSDFRRLHRIPVERKHQVELHRLLGVARIPALVLHTIEIEL
jgi:hypothetical protein